MKRSNPFGVQLAIYLPALVDLSILRRHQPIGRGWDHLGPVRETMAIRRCARRKDGRHPGGDVYRDLFRSLCLASGKYPYSTNVCCSRWRSRFYSRCTWCMHMDMDEGSQWSGNTDLMSASGRKLPVLTVCGLPVMNGQDWPKADADVFQRDHSQLARRVCS